MCSGIRGGEESSKRSSWTNGFTYLPEYTCPPAPWKSAAPSAGGGERYSMECAHHGWHHEPHSPVKNTMCKRWDTPRVSLLEMCNFEASITASATFGHSE